MIGLAAVAAVSSILQIIDFSAKCVAVTKEILASGAGASRDNISIAQLTEQQQSLANHMLQSYDRPLTAQETRAETIAQESKTEARALLALVANLRIDKDLKGARRVLQASRQAAKTVMKRSAIEKQQNRLDRLNAQLSTSLIHILRHVVFLPGILATTVPC
jgi:hypothetical protein